jgi:proteasome lid subunit RPN8/RPN11
MSPAPRFPATTIPPLSLPGSVAAAIAPAALEGHPLEVCGLLVGRRLADRVLVLAVEPAPNLETVRAHDRFFLDPIAFLRVERHAVSRGLAVVGVWHSHPDQPARPSAHDLAAAWPEFCNLIVSVSANGLTELRSFWSLDGDLIEQQVLEPLEP